MRDFFNSPIWQFLGAMLAFLAIVLTIIVYFLQRQNKELTYQLLSFTPLLSIEDEIKGRVKILFDDQAVEEVFLIILKITNTGRVPIAKADYDEMISVSFGESARILSWEIVETTPKALPAKGRIEDGKIIFDPILLNRFDSIKLNALTTGANLDRINVSARIHGVREIQKGVFKDIRSAQRDWVIITVLNSIWLVVGVLLIATGRFATGGTVVGIFVFAIAMSLASLRTKLRRYGR